MESISILLLALVQCNTLQEQEQKKQPYLSSNTTQYEPIESNPLQPNKTQLHHTIMPSTSPIVLILGAGPNIGQSVARGFAAKGYRVAVASRKATGTPDQLHIPSDFSNPSAVTAAFAKAKEALGIPSVVVYNGV
jgi:hypothetical protein